MGRDGRETPPAIESCFAVPFRVKAMQMGFYFDQTRCTGCYTCVVACKDWHDVPAGPAAWRKIATLEQGRFPDVSVAFLAASCYHCSEPACIAACPAGAISKREEDGVVLVSQDKCLGRERCDLCWQACPYRAPQFGAERNAKMQMCDFCVDRLEAGRQPICVAACPMRALDAGPMDELKARHGDIRDAIGFVFSQQMNPSAIFRSRIK